MSLNIYLELDTLIDTRYGKLISIDEKYQDEVLFKFNSYCNRDHDDMWLLFPELDKDTWLNTNDTLETLKLGKRTNICNVIDDVIRAQMGELKVDDANDLEITITLNTQHYDLTPKAEEVFKVLLSSRFEHRYTVNLVSMANCELTSSYLADNYQLVIKYDFNAWVEEHIKDKVDSKLSKVIFYIPTLFRDKQEADRGFFEQINGCGVEGEPLEKLSDFIWEAYRLNVYFISTRFFSPLALG